MGMRMRWKKTLPKVDQQWIAKALFRWKKSGCVVLVHVMVVSATTVCSSYSIPGVDRYFAQPLFLWMPREQWKVRLYCSQPDCEKKELASAEINQKVR
jgi:hypothetical protein